ncbi:hypothetical protein CP10139811_0321 [Chlamydia ibidis]|uniref:Uncharacterized protein n=2 Tax=Chlamydia ibidis TaxID=1405396 RepID=S7J2D0_9CHLA|nr:hypothetical protein [Chlamydia ibidis]EPP34388.1 hypothetical protein CP10139811_0321 [Chlamydia ibidis]EQM63043.1 hypothetical protein H359_0433 [Chlamydia ibidis 10-1398/6]
MMSSKRTSQLAMLSILLTFSHTVGQASTGVAAVELNSVCLKDEAAQSSKPRSRKQARVSRAREEARKQKREQRVQNQGPVLRVDQRLGAPKKSKAHRKNSQKSLASREGRVSRSGDIVSLLSNGFNFSRTAKKQSQKESQSVACSFSSRKQSNKLNNGGLITKVRGATEGISHDEIAKCSVQGYGRKQRLQRHKQKRLASTNRSSSSVRDRVMETKHLATRIIPSEENIVSVDKPVTEKSEVALNVQHEFKNPVLPIFVRPEAKQDVVVRPVEIAAAEVNVVVQEDTTKLIQDLAREQRIAKRKSAREALQAKAKENRIPRDGTVTSTLRYDVEKAAAVRARRNASVNPQVRAQKISNTRRAAQGEQKKKSSNEEKADPQSDVAKTAEKAADVANRTITQDKYYEVAAASGNSNVDSYIKSNRYRCDSSEVDWPCSSCVAKRRAHTSISVCTMVVTIIAMIVGAVIIANASDTPATPGGGTGGNTGGTSGGSNGGTGASVSLSR